MGFKKMKMTWRNDSKFSCNISACAIQKNVDNIISHNNHNFCLIVGLRHRQGYFSHMKDGK